MACVEGFVRRALASWHQRRKISKDITLKKASGVCGGAAERLQSGTLFLGPKRDPDPWCCAFFVRLPW